MLTMDMVAMEVMVDTEAMVATEDMDMDVNEDQLSPTTDMAVVMEATVDMVVMEVMDMVVNID